MLRRTLVHRNTFLTPARAQPPVTEIRSGPRHWSDPDRMLRMKMMYFTMGLDQQALRRTAVIQNDRARFKFVKMHLSPGKGRDPTGFREARTRQIVTWHKRIQYQEYLMQHMFVRQTWRVLRKYPVGGAKIDGVINTPYIGYDPLYKKHRFLREALPSEAPVLYPRRALTYSKR
jgi:hypothetical protein